MKNSMRHKNNHGVISIAMMAIGMWVSAVFSGGITQVVIEDSFNKGRIPIVADGATPNDPANKVETRKAAIADAQKNATEKAVGDFVTWRAAAGKADRTESETLRRASGRVKKYKVLSEGVDGDVYRVKMQAMVYVKVRP